MLLAIPQPADALPGMYWQRTFPGRPEQARTARAFLTALLSDHPCLHDMLLVVNELVVNALQHSLSGAEGGTFRLEVMLDAAGVTAVVADQGGPSEPTVRKAGDLEVSGRGLATVAALTTSWNWSGDESGRRISARFPRGADASADWTPRGERTR
jgi:anti-sigma regulatory factor (Ser/Thr protein kinase)